METTNKTRVLIAKPGLDGHDKGAKIVALALRDAGMEVIYSGLHQTLDQIIHTATQEAVVGGIDDHVHLEFGDVRLDDINMHV